MNKVKNIIAVLLFLTVLFSLSIICFLKPESEYSNAERRALKKLPEINAEAVISGSFMDEFEGYSQDQFPFREKFRSLKAFFNLNILRKKDNNGLFIADGHISKIDEKENEYMMDYSAKKFTEIYNKYLKDNNANVHLSIVPDKNFILADKNGYPSLDYKGFISKMREKLPFMKYIDITSFLSEDDFYRTDTHWKQEKIVDIAKYLNNAMETSISESYDVKTLDNPFYGVYYGQLGLNFKPDIIKYLTNDIIENYSVTYFETGKPQPGELYNMEKASGKDPYEMFLSGTMPLVTIENENALLDKELILFRDSFGSSIAPIMAEGYKKVTIVDIRYIQSSFLGSLIDFKDKDVLFLFSTTLLNNSLAMK